MMGAIRFRLGALFAESLSAEFLLLYQSARNQLTYEQLQYTIIAIEYRHNMIRQRKITMRVT